MEFVEKKDLDELIEAYLKENLTVEIREIHRGSECHSSSSEIDKLAD